MTIKIIEVTDQSLEKRFIDLPWKIYQNYPNWVPPLKVAIKDILSKKHPFYLTSTIKLWLAVKDGADVGRIAATINQEHNRFHNENCGFFGFFETINDKDVASALLDQVNQYLTTNGLNVIRGPMNPSTNYECGLLIDGYDDPPQIMMTYNPGHYAEFLTLNGYDKVKDLLAYKIQTNFDMPDRIEKVAARIEKSSKVTYRQINLNDWDNEINRMYHIYNDAWEKNWGFIPMSYAEFKQMGKELRPVIDKRLILFAEVDGDPAGFIVALPDYNRIIKTIKNGRLFPAGIFKLLFNKKKIDRSRVITLGIKLRYRTLALGTLLYKKIYDIMQTTNYKEIEMSWVLEDNYPMKSPLIQMGADPYKTYRIYQKDLVTHQ